jgi:hypothetical protein
MHEIKNISFTCWYVSFRAGFSAFIRSGNEAE